MVVAMKSPSETSLWFAGPRTNPNAQLRLFCFPYAGGGTLMYRNWARNLPATIEICRAQLPGREVRLKESGLTRLNPLVLALADAIEPYLDLPFAFFGHSMGTLIAFELTRELQRRHGLTPTNLSCQHTSRRRSRIAPRYCMIYPSRSLSIKSAVSTARRKKCSNNRSCFGS